MTLRRRTAASLSVSSSTDSAASSKPRSPRGKGTTEARRQPGPFALRAIFHRQNFGPHRTAWVKAPMTLLSSPFVNRTYAPCNIGYYNNENMPGALRSPTIQHLNLC